MARNFIAIAASCMICCATHGGVIVISDMNADSDNASALEGTLFGNSTSGLSTLAIDNGPSISPVDNTFADYTVANVDIDGDNVFSESFRFRISFSAANDQSNLKINFNDSREVLAVGADNSDDRLDVGDEFAMFFSVLSDTSGSHDVTIDGVFALDFTGLTNSDFDIVSDVSGSTTVTLDSLGEVSLGGFFINPTITYANTGNTTNRGALEEWSVQFTTTAATAVPEPASLGLVATTMMTGMLALHRRRRTRG